MKRERLYGGIRESFLPSNAKALRIRKRLQNRWSRPWERVWVSMKMVENNLKIVVDRQNEQE